MRAPAIDPQEIEQKLEKLRRACIKKGLRMTHQRMEVFREVAQTTEHPDADTIFQRVRERLPMLSHDTVYRTLASLEEMGLISRLNTLCGRVRYDANCEPHHHFVCTKCGRISDIYFEQEPALPEGLETIGKPLSIHIKVSGICQQCNK